ncbi:fructosamine kinase family protein [Lipingzhangella sp. LS1_29]|uniref:Fructosamine kinase family protein n=1 Tax=Lipingzhangella rawalii TaxID=2055835 RepID=A0ABU2H4B5_9ACTN|nr:fructosamine kinase family protein [Lipingzhangella rawalii]MDS1270142.1 fructosamine kinase family protein [Lipingzhangella rawalii]
MLTEVAGVEVRSQTALGSSHAWTLHRGELADGQGFFAKIAPGHSEALDVEATGLHWLGEVPNGVPVPEVLATGAGTLVLEWIPEARPSADAAEELGRRLARTHLAGAESFGAPWPGWLATLPLDNTAGDHWPTWFAEHRLRPYLRRARDAGSLHAQDVATVEKVLGRIEHLAGPAEPPARIHGDLWAGNILWSRSGAVVIDPAAHGGHRESDLAMLHLFGAPHLDRLVHAYTEIAPLAEGWRDRIALHQLHPLLAHVCLFGTSYRAQLLQACTGLGAR